MSGSQQIATRPPLVDKRHELLGHASLGVKSYAKAKAFYDEVMATLGATCVYDNSEDRVFGYGPQYDLDLELLTIFENAQSSSAGAGFHIAFNAPNRESVRKFWEAAVQHGGSDEGKWGLREEYGEFYYAAFVRDPDGNKLEAVFQEADEESVESSQERQRISVIKQIIQKWDENSDRQRTKLSQELKGMNVTELERKLQNMN